MYQRVLYQPFGRQCLIPRFLLPPTNMATSCERQTHGVAVVDWSIVGPMSDAHHTYRNMIRTVTHKPY